MLQLIAIIIFALAFRYVRGDGDLNNDGKKDVPRWAWVVFAVVFCFVSSRHWFPALCWSGIVLLIGTLPTHTLFSAIHGKLPARRDHRLVQWMQDAALVFRGKNIGIAYGFFRAVPAFPLMVGLIGFYATPWASLLLVPLHTHGLVYWVWGKLGNPREAVEYSELTIGTALAAGVVLCA